MSFNAIKQNDFPWYFRLTVIKKPRPTPKDGYCELWEKHPERLEKEGIPRGYYGLCEVCGKPGHTRHFPGTVPYTDSWCELHYRRLIQFHPGSTVGCCFWLTVFIILGVIVWKYLL